MTVPHTPLSGRCPNWEEVFWMPDTLPASRLASASTTKSNGLQASFFWTDAEGRRSVHKKNQNYVMESRIASFLAPIVLSPPLRPSTTCGNAASKSLTMTLVATRPASRQILDKHIFQRPSFSAENPCARCMVPQWSSGRPHRQVRAVRKRRRRKSTTRNMWGSSIVTWTEQGQRQRHRGMGGEPSHPSRLASASTSSFVLLWCKQFRARPLFASGPWLPMRSKPTLAKPTLANVKVLVV